MRSIMPGIIRFQQLSMKYKGFEKRHWSFLEVTEMRAGRIQPEQWSVPCSHPQQNFCPCIQFFSTFQFNLAP